MFSRKKRYRQHKTIIEEQANAAIRRFQTASATDETLNEGDIDDREDLWEDEEYE